MTKGAALQLRDLRVTLRGQGSPFSPVDGVGLDVRPGEILGLAGESGSGKSLTLKAILGLLPPQASVTGDLRLGLQDEPPRPYDPQVLRGHGIGMIFQEPMTALNPTMRVGDLIALGPRLHQGLSRRAARARAVELMREVGIPDAPRRARAWPHQLSGGLRQRVMIAAALATEPRLLLCDEPTTALDVTVQDQILHLLRRIRRERGTTIVFVTHDLPVIGDLCDRVAVMYAGRIMEVGPVAEVFASPRHPYTRALMESAPSLDEDQDHLDGIGGQPPDPRAFPTGCRFAPRCPLAQADCRKADYALRPVESVSGASRTTACIHHERLGEVAA